MVQFPFLAVAFSQVATTLPHRDNTQTTFLDCLAVQKTGLGSFDRARIVRGVFSAREPDSSVGGVPVVNCPDVDHMEEEVQVSAQVQEEGIGETHGKEQGEEQRFKQRTTAQRE